MSVEKGQLAMRILEESGDWLSAREIHDKMGGEGCSPSHILRTLEDRGLVVSKRIGQRKVYKIASHN